MSLKKYGRFIGVLVLALLIVCTPLCAAAETVTVLCRSEESVGIGRSIDVILSVESDAKLKAIQFVVKYDNDSLSFSSVSSEKSGEFENSDQNGEAMIIALFDEPVGKGDILTVKFTAKTGRSSSSQVLCFEPVQAVDGDANDLPLSMTDEVSFSVVKKSEASSDSIHSESNETASVNNSVSENKTSVSKAAKGSSEKSQSQNVKDTLSKDKSKTESSHNSQEEGQTNPSESDSGAASITQYGERRQFGVITDSDNAASYIFLGVGISVCAAVMLFAVYRIGQLSIRKTDSERIFLNDENVDKKD